MNMRHESYKNKMHIFIDRSVDLRDFKKRPKYSVSPKNKSPNRMSPKGFKDDQKVKFPTIGNQSHMQQPTRTPSVRKNKFQLPQQLVQELDNEKKYSFSSAKNQNKQIKFVTEERKSSFSVHKLAQEKNRSISNVLSKNSLGASTQVDDYDDNKAIRFIKGKILNSDLMEELQKMENITSPNQLQSLRDSMLAIIEQGKLQRKFKIQGGTDEQFKQLEIMYLQNERLVKNYLQIKSEAQEVDMRVRMIHQKKHLRH